MLVCVLLCLCAADRPGDDGAEASAVVNHLLPLRGALGGFKKGILLETRTYNSYNVGNRD